MRPLRGSRPPTPESAKDADTGLWSLGFRVALEYHTLIPFFLQGTIMKYLLYFFLPGYLTAQDDARPSGLRCGVLTRSLRSQSVIPVGLWLHRVVKGS